MDRNGNRIGPRRTVGVADPATRRAAINAAVAPPARAKRQPATANGATSTATGVSPNAARLLRDRGKQINKAVDDAS